tara:strand:+ start:1045 stop:1305 length:261 start_codon:yes stop_codon:yes gene_type:complete
MANVSINLTETQYKGLEYVSASPQDWADNVVTNRARIAIDEIVKIYTERALDEGVQIPATRELIVVDAFTRGWVKTAQQRNEESSE